MLACPASKGGDFSEDRANTPENARLTFDHVVSDRLQDMVDTNFKFFKRVNDDQEFAKFFLDWLFDRFRRNVEG